ncbi:hypothetical protein AKJ09_11149 [Labilithrix luteola]|uniref:DUF5063 domain-containing protein n=1 Tax=Labilithrix luteola TaxID=1391654 RepID=A0A0K1QFD4_9BACT|nr:DUF5063 domain-containing protein [Labilithrix luteola]AKV04486.1 hypothetical protein AKJ09_11149 [Labilithrix luteola]
MTPPAFADLLTPDVTAFVRAARDYCAFMLEAPKLSVPERLATARARLLELYAAGARLPDAVPDPHREAPRFTAPEGWTPLDEYDFYWTAFDAFDPESSEAIVGSLDDDLVETYQDVREGLWHWERGEFADAVWQWRFGFLSHWGAHAVEALRAIHHALEKVRGSSG